MMRSMDQQTQAPYLFTARGGGETQKTNPVPSAFCIPVSQLRTRIQTQSTEDRDHRVTQENTAGVPYLYTAWDGGETKKHRVCPFFD